MIIKDLAIEQLSKLKLNQYNPVLWVNVAIPSNEMGGVHTRTSLEALINSCRESVPVKSYSVVVLNIPTTICDEPLDRNKLYCIESDYFVAGCIEIACKLLLPNGLLITNSKLDNTNWGMSGLSDGINVKNKKGSFTGVLPNAVNLELNFKPIDLFWYNNRAPYTDKSYYTVAEDGKYKLYLSTTDSTNMGLDFDVVNSNLDKPYDLISRCEEQVKALINGSDAAPGAINQHPSSAGHGVAVGDIYKRKLKMSYPVRISNEYLYWVTREGQRFVDRDTEKVYEVTRVTYKSNFEPPIVEYKEVMT